MQDALIHLPGDGTWCSEADIAGARAHANSIRSIYYSARGYIDSHNLDPKIFLPGNIWASIDKPENLIGWSEEQINLARCLSPYSGFLLITWRRQDDPGEADPAAMTAVYSRLFASDLARSEINPLIAKHGAPERMLRTRDALIAHWESLVAHTPERYRLTFPAVAGEAGVMHQGRIINPDLLSAQSRMNAIYGSGALVNVERAIADNGFASYLEIGSGCGVFAHAVAQCFEGKLRAFLIDLPAALLNATAYLTCAAGTASIELVTQETRVASTKPYTLIANYLVPAYRPLLPKIDLAHNAISMNEMTEGQVQDYFNLLGAVLADDGVFHLAQGTKALDYHVDALTLGQKSFTNYAIYGGYSIDGVPVIESPNSFFRLGGGPLRFPA